VAGAPAVDEVEPLLRASGFVNIKMDLKEESREFIKEWLPGSGCENYVVSANITAYKPAAVEPPKAESEDAGCCATK
jgi:arsenite methyltransferase